MKRRSPIHVLAKAVLVVLAAGCGTAAGGLLAVAFSEITAPGAGFDVLFPLLVLGVGGSVAGVFAELAVLFKVPRISRERAMGYLTPAIGLGLLAGLGFVAAPSGGAWVAGAVAGLPLLMLIGLLLGSSLAYGRRDIEGRDR